MLKSKVIFKNQYFSTFLNSDIEFVFFDKNLVFKVQKILLLAWGINPGRIHFIQTQTYAPGASKKNFLTLMAEKFAVT